MPLGVLLIDPHRLIILREVARAGSFAQTAATLRQTPSAISQQIAALERAAGIRVVNRSTRGVTLTEAGHVLLSAADAIHAELQTAGRQLEELKAYGPRTLTVFTFPSAGEPLLAPALSALTRSPDFLEHPVDTTVTESEPNGAVAALRNGDADLALVYHFHSRKPPREWGRVAAAATYIPLLDDKLQLLVPSDHRLADRTSVSLTEVAEERWIHGWGETGDFIDSLAAASGFRPKVACRSSDYRFMSALVGAGVGVALVPSLALTHSPDVTALALSPQPARHVGAYLSGRHRRSNTGEALLNALQTRAQTLA